VEHLESTAEAFAEAALDDGFRGVSPAARIAMQSRMRAAVQRLDAARVSVLTLIHDDGLYQVQGGASMPNWLAVSDLISKETAVREIDRAEKLRDHLPVTADLELRGELGAEYVDVLVKLAPTTDARRAALAHPVSDWTASDAEQMERDIDDVPTGEETLLWHASRLNVAQFKSMVRHFAKVADRKAADAEYARAEENEHFQLSATIGGFHLSGFLTTEHGLWLQRAIDRMSHTYPTALSDADAATHGESDTHKRIPAHETEAIKAGAETIQGTMLRHQQRAAQALADLARMAMDSSYFGDGAVEKRHIVVNVSATEFESITSATMDRLNAEPALDSLSIRDLMDPDRASATFADAVGSPADTPIPSWLLKEIACDGAIKRVIFGPKGQPIDVGRTYRVVPKHIRLAVIGRDRHCTYPGCTQPPHRCEVHHAVTHWADGGETSIENSALLCWAHHHEVDGKGITMRWDTRFNVWRFYDRHGREIVAPMIGRALAERANERDTHVTA
jgi:hypothetical protein